MVIPDWLSNAAHEATDRAVALSNQTPPGYGGQVVADQSPYTTQAYNEIAGLQGSANPAFGAAANTWSGLIGQANPITADEINALSSSLYGNYNNNAGGQAQNYFGSAQGQSQNYFGSALGQTQGLLGSYLANAGPATAQQVGANATALMSPYTAQVIDPAYQAGQQQLALAKQGIAGNANQVGAFGGSRQGVQEGVADAQTALGTQQFIGNMLNTGWNSALTPAYNLASNASQQGYNAGALLGQQGYGAAGALAQQGYGAAGQMAGLGATAYGQGLGAGQGVANTDLQSGLLAAQQLPGQAVTQANLGQTQAGALQAAGTGAQNYQQQLLNAQMGGWNTQQQQPYQNLDVLLAALGGVPYSTSGQSNVANTATTTKNVAGSVLGGAASGAATGAAFGPYGALAGGVIGGVLGASS
jgi:hypothetical protein